MDEMASKYILILSLLFFAPFAVAEETTTRTYRLPDHGSIQLQVPRSWKEELRQPPRGLPPTIVFTPTTGASFQILLTPIFSVHEGMTLPTPSQLRMNVERAAENAKGQALEKTILVEELKGPSAIGYYFSATDRAPRPGEYKYMTQGMLRVGELAPTFTVLSNDGAGNIVAQSLSMLKGAAHVKKAP